MRNQPVVSIVIPIKGVDAFLESCLQSIRLQTYRAIEILIIDNKPSYALTKIAKQYNAGVHYFKGVVKAGKFDAPQKRNLGGSLAQGKYIYYLDTDMTLPNDLISEAVQLCESKFDALILPEDSFGVGIWADAKHLERRCYWGDDTVEAARFLKKSVWDKLGGLDTSLGGGGDDWDLHQKLLQNGYLVGRTKSVVLHNEGNLKLRKLTRKRFMYGRDSIKYLIKKPKQSFISYFPIRLSYLRNWRLFLSNPRTTVAFIVMRFSEYCAGFAGIVLSLFERFHDEKQ